MNAPFVSIVIPSYNSAPFLHATIESSLGQLGCSCEVIVIDDGSTDDTRLICDRFKDQIKYIWQENTGVSAARNLGAIHAKGEWLLFLDSDDRLLPTAIRDLVMTANHSAAGVVYGMVIERTQQPNKPRLNGFNFCAGSPPEPAKRNYWRSAVITPGSAIVHSDIHKQIGGFVQTYEPMEDRDYWIKCGLLTSFAFADIVVLDKMWRPASAGSQNARRIWNGLRSRLAFSEWCRERRLEYEDFLIDPRILIEHAVKEAVWCGSIEILEPLLREAKKCKTSLLWRIRAWLALWLHIRRRLPLPSWWLPLQYIRNDNS